MGKYLRHMFIYFLCIFTFLNSPCTEATLGISKGNSNLTTPNVVFIMLDGVRWQDVFYGSDSGLSGKPALYPIFSSFDSTGLLFGDPKSDVEMRVSNHVCVSLPGYQSVMAGYEQWCFTNDCGQIKNQTFAERIRQELGLPRDKVAAFSSWEKIPQAFAKDPNDVFVNSGNTLFLDRKDQHLRPELESPEEGNFLESINQLQAQDLAKGQLTRKDEYTIALAKHYLKHHQPRLLFIQLDQSDSFAHASDYAGYIDTLKKYDSWIAEIKSILSQMGEYGSSTSLIVTTDHGRASGGEWFKKDWSTHGDLCTFGSSQIWMYAETPATRQAFIEQKQTEFRKGSYYHSDIRPTIEALFDLNPYDCFWCGEEITELTSSYSGYNE